MDYEIHKEMSDEILWDDFLSTPSYAYSHPIDDFSYHSTFRVFEDDIKLDDNQQKVALRMLKYFYETSLFAKLSDELFLDLVRTIPYLAPLHPLASPYARLGYIRPLIKMLEKYNRKDIKIEGIMSFITHMNGRVEKSEITDKPEMWNNGSMN